MMIRLDVDGSRDISYSEWVAALCLLPDANLDAAGES
jgi:hypothetical protein